MLDTDHSILETVCISHHRYENTFKDMKLFTNTFHVFKSLCDYTWMILQFFTEIINNIQGFPHFSKH